jgi:hypothetical protein
MQTRPGLWFDRNISVTPLDVSFVLLFNLTLNRVHLYLSEHLNAISSIKKTFQILS